MVVYSRFILNIYKTYGTVKAGAIKAREGLVGGAT